MRHGYHVENARTEILAREWFPEARGDVSARLAGQLVHVEHYGFGRKAGIVEARQDGRTHLQGELFLVLRQGRGQILTDLVGDEESPVTLGQGGTLRLRAGRSAPGRAREAGAPRRSG